MFRLAHLSDIHLGPLPPVRMHELVSKRITGYANWRLGRARHRTGDDLAVLVKHMKGQHPDAVAITGDLINLGLAQELEPARRWLESLGPVERVLMVCGNHDAYVPGALRRALSVWQDWAKGENSGLITGARDYPVVRRYGRVSLIGCNSARASGPFLATGYFREAQSRRLEQMLADEGEIGQCRIVMIHHPPFSAPARFHSRLVGARHFRNAIAAAGAEMVLHGHTHVESIANVAGPAGPVPVIGVPSASQGFSGRNAPGRYNWFEIAPDGAGWSIVMREFGRPGPASAVAKLDERQIA
jgi:3',5'-cyclic AMP phosphodiesterase CpdA